MSSVVRILIVDDERDNRSKYADLIANGPKVAATEPSGRGPVVVVPEIVQLPAGRSALRELREAAGRGRPYDVLVTDLFMPGMDGLRLIEQLPAAGLGPDGLDIVLVSRGDQARSRQAEIDAACATWGVDGRSSMSVILLVELLDEDRFLEAVWRGVLERVRMRAERGVVREVSPRDAGEQGPLMSTTHPRLLADLERIERLLDAPVPTTLLLYGPTGVGKGRLAKRIHRRSSRARMPFIPIRCSAIASTLEEGLLFGWCKGSFTGATGDHMGLFESASGGTCFLDELDKASPALQQKLLGPCDDEPFVVRIGESEPRRIDLRIIAGCSQDIGARVKRGEFLEDLWHRIYLPQSTLHIPALAERPEDIPALALEISAGVLASLDRPPLEWTPAALNRMQTSPWPGNTRTLKKFITTLVGNRRSTGAISAEEVQAHLSMGGEWVDGLAALDSTLQRFYHQMFFPRLEDVIALAKNKAEANRALLGPLLASHGFYFPGDEDAKAGGLDQAWENHRSTCRTCGDAWKHRWAK